MKRTHLLTFSATLAALLWAGAAPAQQMGAPASANGPSSPASAAPAAPGQPQAQDGAQATVKRAVEGVTSAINADKGIQSGDRSKIIALVDNKIVPFVDTQEMTRRAVGPNWNKASGEQQKALVQEFKMLLINTYAGAFSTYRPDTQIQYKAGRDSGDASVVRTQVLANGRDPIPIDYYMEKEAGGWKLVDISIYNARLVELYKSQFSAAIAQGGVDGLIRDLKAKNGSDARAKS
ncbi:MAG TPA: ABC transporter substrate-binding protein [Burkholderiales bacterium]